MTDVMDFRGDARRIEDLDIPRIGSRIGVGEDEIHAFMDVEAAGSGFDRLGRPKMLFEPHIFYRHLEGDNLRRALEEGLAYPKWGTMPYPSDSYPRLVAAMEIDEVAALMSASWGLGQILGQNHELAGYNTVDGMVRAFMEDEEYHLEAIVNYIMATDIADDLREHRWENVARVYNGPSYAKHGYHTRMKAAYEKWTGIKDTPWDPSMDDSIAPIRYPIVEFGHKGFVTEHLQSLLKARGYAIGAVDGHFGQATRAAVLAYQADNGLSATGRADEATWASLTEFSRPRPVSEKRAASTMADLRTLGSETVKQGDKAQTLGGLLVAVGSIGGITEAAGQAGKTTEAVSGLVQTVAPAVEFARENMVAAFIVVGFGVLYYVHQMKKSRLEDHKSGANLGR